MFRLSQLGLVSLASSILLVLFQAIQSIINDNFVWKKMRISDMLSPDYYSWTENISVFSLDSVFARILDMPLYFFLFLLAVTLLLFSFVFERK